MRNFYHFLKLNHVILYSSIQMMLITSFEQQNSYRLKPALLQICYYNQEIIETHTFRSLTHTHKVGA